MTSTTTFATITNDTGFASELVHVSPIFARCGPSRRGQYADRREARTRRSDARVLTRYTSRADVLAAESATSEVEFPSQGRASRDGRW